MPPKREPPKRTPPPAGIPQTDLELEHFGTLSPVLPDPPLDEGTDPHDTSTWMGWLRWMLAGGGKKKINKRKKTKRKKTKRKKNKSKRTRKRKKR